MVDDQNQQVQSNEQGESKDRNITTTVTCPHCGKEHDVTVQVPEADEAPKMAWQG